MIKLPELQAGNRTQQMTTTFTGYNRREVLYDGQMYDTKNMSGDQYPMLSVRKKRGITEFPGNDKLTGINGRDQLTFVRGTNVYWALNPTPVLTVSDDPAMCPKQIVNFGAYVCIWPDKKYFNTVNLSDAGSMERLYSVTGDGVSLTMCRKDGTDYDMTAISGPSATPPSTPANGQLWLDSSTDADVLRQWTESTEEWVEVPTTYVKITAAGIGNGIRDYDAIDLSGLEGLDGVSERIQAQISALNGSHIVYGAGSSYIIVVGLLSQTQLALKSQTVRADITIPDMDYITESNNRLWGCKYGLVNGQVINEIRCSALGSFRIWKRFLGNSQDSWVASVGTDGPFTAAVTQKGYPVFFKENVIHQVYGQGPSTFQINSVVCRGVQNGSGRSAVVVNEQVYYKSRTDVMMFDGSMPVSVSEQLGGVLYKNARAGAIGRKYYISMQDKGNTWHMFTYDTEKQCWYHEDNFHALGFGRVDDELYAIDEENNTLVSIYGSLGETEDDFEWMADFGLSGVRYVAGNSGFVRDDTGGSRYLSRFNIRMYLEEGSRAELEIMYDDDGEWHRMGTLRGTRTRNMMIPVMPRRCDHLRFRLKGAGECRIYSIARMLEVGSDG